MKVSGSGEDHPPEAVDHGGEVDRLKLNDIPDSLPVQQIEPVRFNVSLNPVHYLP